MTTYADNKRSLRNYTILEEFEAGIALAGHEVKAVRNGKASLAGSHVVIRGNEAFLVGATIASYQPANMPKEYDPERPRKLLLNKKEIAALAGHEKKKGLTIVPVSMYNKGRLVKVRVAIARGAKKFDKREKIKRRDTERDVARSLKKRFRF